MSSRQVFIDKDGHEYLLLGGSWFKKVRNEKDLPGTRWHMLYKPPAPEEQRRRERQPMRQRDRLEKPGPLEQTGGSVRMRYMVSEFDYREPRSQLEAIDTGGHLEALAGLSQRERMDQESSDIFVQLNHRGERVRVIVRRDPEKRQGSEVSADGEDSEVDPDDATAKGRSVQTSALSAQELGDGVQGAEDDTEDGLELPPQKAEGRWLPPREKWDLVYLFEPCGRSCQPPYDQCPNHRRFSAPIFVAERWSGKLTGRTKAQGKDIACQELFDFLEAAIRFSKKVPHGRYLFKMAENLPGPARKRLWEVYRAEKFFREKGQHLPPGEAAGREMTEEEARVEGLHRHPDSSPRKEV